MQTHKECGGEIMQLKTAIKVLERRAQFYGKTLEWLVDAMDNHMDEIMRVEEAYTVYKKATQ